MNWKIYLCIALILLGVSVWVNEHYYSYKEISLYQGAVPEGYDLEYFRLTGLTKPLNVTQPQLYSSIGGGNN